MNLCRVPITFLLVTLSFVFFRAADVPQALKVFERLFTMPGAGVAAFSISATGILMILIASDVAARRGWQLDALPRSIRWGIYYVLIAAIVLLGGGDAHFLYFQF